MNGIREKLIVDGASHALLHDIGKPLVRLCWRSREKMEGLSPDIEAIVNILAINAKESWELGLPEEADVDKFKEFVRKILVNIMDSRRGEHVCYSHENVTQKILSLLGFSFNQRVDKIVKDADIHSAFERRDVDVSKTDLAISGISLKHYNTPLLNPFKLASYLGLTTHTTLDLELRENNGSLDIILRECKGKCVIALGSNCYFEVKEGLQNLSASDLAELVNVEAWHPIRPLRWRKWSLDNYRAYPLLEAMHRSSYIDVVSSLLSGLFLLSEVAGEIDRVGVVETLLGVLRRSLLYVPSAVYKSATQIVIPELSLYAHSRATAAIAQALLHPDSHDNSSYRVLVIDLKGIQKYIHAQKIVSAAVRSFRGRSLIVELVQRAIARWVLRRLGLTWSSILTYEGGRVSIVVPCFDEKDLEELANDLEDRVRNEFMDLLGITVAWTDCIKARKSQGTLYNFDIESGDTLAGQLYKMNTRLQERRFKILDFSGEVYSPNILYTDPLLDRQITEDNWVSIDQGDTRILRIAGDDGGRAILDEGGASLDTLRSLIAGTAAVNLALIIEFYTEDEGSVYDLVNVISKRLELWTLGDNRLAFKSTQINGYRIKIGVIPFAKINALYLLASLDTDITGKDVDDIIRDNLMLSRILINELKESLVAGDKVKGVSRVVITVVNFPEVFTSLIGDARLLASALNLGVSLDWIPLNTFYPLDTSDSEEGSVVYKSLDDAVASGVLAVASMDGDNMGNMMIFMAAGSSRFATASELLSNTFGFHAVNFLYRALKSGELKSLYVAFSGGDDIVMFGDFHDIAKSVVELAKLYTSMLPGSTISASIATGEVKEPLYLLFEDSKDSLTKAKKTPLLNISGTELNEPITWREGIVNVHGAFEEIPIPITNGQETSILTIDGIPYRGPASLQKSIELANNELKDTTTRSWARRMLLAVKPLIKYTPQNRIGLEAATALIQYSYINERSKRLETGDGIPSILLRQSTSNIIEIKYPHGKDTNLEREKLILALKLSANPLNLAIHLARTHYQ